MAPVIVSTSPYRSRNAERNFFEKLVRPACPSLMFCAVPKQYRAMRLPLVDLTISIVTGIP